MSAREVRRRVRVADPDGLHARPCARLVRAAEPFRSAAALRYGERAANVRSVLELLALGVLSRDEVELRVAGEDAEECAAAIERVLADPGAPPPA